MRKKAILEKGSKLFFFLCALFSIGAVLFICYFIFANAIPAIQQVGDVYKRQRLPTAMLGLLVK